ncbi:MAG: dTDP-glucose 4,6-dehydratase [Anaerolineaceae bacterium]|jgi:dTDP-glucose 4,6-dehydratase|nr:dTDP-glucose 4,6-dehydratase [Anaerolineaceae bacterium]
MKNMLITGGAGFIGANFTRYILQNDPQAQIVNLDLLTYAGSLENLRDLPDESRYTFVNGDICDRELIGRLINDHAINIIVHFAAETHVDRSIFGPSTFVQTNVIGAFTLLDAARKAWLEDKVVPVEQARFHHISTDEVFGSLQPEDPPFSETTPYAPRSPYAASKASSDHLALAYHHTYGLPVTITNCSNNYGPYQFPEKLIPLMIANALERKPLPVYGDGQQIRDWLHVEDHCEAIYRVLQNGRLGETYLVGGDNQTRNLDLVQTLCAIMDEVRPGAPHTDLIRFVPDRPGHDRRYAIDASKIHAELGWAPRHNLRDGLRQTVQWYLDHPQWIEAIRDQGGYQDWIERNYAQRTEERS